MNKIKLLEEIRLANEVQVDATWAVLKYKEIGIFRKVACICEVLGLDFQEISEELPQDENGRILDHNTRHMIHDALIEVSQKS